MRSGTLPTGTVTFLFTDVEGSTKLLHQLGAEGYAAALQAHRQAIRDACAANGGVEVDTQGDAFFVAFPTAPGALRAAAAATRALEAGPIRVRMGLHTGTPLLAEEGYVGIDVHRAARIAAAGHGGQVLVSASTAALLDVGELEDLGEHRLKDLAAPERVYQLGQGRFPPVRSLSPSNLPVPATAFLGREAELERVGELLADPDLRILTLTGPGGTGKTRLAIQAAAESSERFPGGLWWVALAPLEDPTLVLAEIAASLGIEARSDPALVETITVRSAGRRTLVVLDNAEHLLPRLAEELAPLVRGGDGPTLLITSRERVHLEAERELPVPSMSAPDARAFFRARADALGVQVDPSPALDELCERLDRLPLALQLAAVRLKLFSVEQLLARLSQRLDLPGERDADPRQRTLRATIAWSHDLLDDPERALLRRLSVFAGGGTLEAVEQVCDTDPGTLLSLVDKSLVRRRDDAPEPRFWMLETIKAFAVERLEEAGEVETTRDAHARWFLEAGRRWDRDVRRAMDRRPWLDALEADLDNVRIALTWAEDRGDVELLQGLAGSMRLYWHLRGLYREGRRWLELAYRLPHLPTASILPVLDGLSSVAYLQGDYDRALEIAEEALAIRGSAGGEERLRAMTNLANALSAVDRLDEAIVRYEEAVDIARAIDDPLWLATALINRGDAGLIAARWDEAAAYLEEGIGVSRAHGIAAGIAVGLIDLATASFQLGRDEEAARHAVESLEAGSDVSDMAAIALLILAGTRARGGDVEGAARRLGASEAVRAATGYELEPTEQALFATVMRYLGDAADDPAFRAARDEGRALEAETAKGLASEG